MRARSRLLISAVLALGIALAPLSAASAATPPNPIPGPIGTAYNLFDYMLSVKSQQLMSMQGDAAIGAWSSENARLAAKSANSFRAGSLYGNIGAQALAEVVPITDPLTVGYGLGRTIKPGPGTPGFRVPAFRFAGVVKGVGLAGVAVTGFQVGGMIGAGLINNFGGLIGVDDANGNVCSQISEIDGGGLVGGLLGFASGQDCDAFLQTQAYIEQANADATAGVIWGQSCNSVGDCWNPTDEYFVGTNKYAGSCLTVTSGYSGGVQVQLHITAIGFSGGLGPGVGCSVPDAINNSSGQGYVIGLGNNTVDWHVLDYRLSERNGTFTADYVEPSIGTADPERTFVCTITDTDGGTYSGTSEPFHEGQAESLPEFNCPSLPGGKYAAHWTIVETGGPEELVLVDEDADPAYADWAAESGDLCSQQSCFLDLVTVADGLSCFGKNDACDGWLTDPDRDTKYQCTYGNVATSIQSCYAYGTTFNTANRLAGAGYADPATGEPIPGGGVTRSAEQELFDLSPRSVDEVRDCLGGTYGAFNPIEWIMRPVQCALEWAFVPRAAVAPALGATLEAAWVTKAPGQLATMIGSWSFSPVVSGCSITVPYSMLGTTTNITVLDACSGPMATVATLCRLLVSLSFSVGVFFAVKRAVGKTVDYY